MANDGSRIDWSLRVLRDDVRFANYLFHVLACARDSANGLLAAHRVRTHGGTVMHAPDERSLDEEAYRRAESSIFETLGGDRKPMGSQAEPASGRPERRADFDPTRDLVNLIANAESMGIAVTWCEGDVRIGGFIYRPVQRTARRRESRAPPRDVDARQLPSVTIGDLVVVLNPAQDWIETFEVVLHELAHALLGHLGVRPPVRQALRMIADRARPPWDAREFEASSAAHLVHLRRGGRPGKQVLRLLAHFAALKDAGALKAVDLLEIFRAAEPLAAWCRIRPQSVGVIAPRGPRPVGPAVGRARPTEDQAARERGDLELVG